MQYKCEPHAFGKNYTENWINRAITAAYFPWHDEKRDFDFIKWSIGKDTSLLPKEDRDAITFHTIDNNGSPEFLVKYKGETFGRFY